VGEVKSTDTVLEGLEVVDGASNTGLVGRQLASMTTCDLSGAAWRQRVEMLAIVG
jgi:hypothetical protein